MTDKIIEIATYIVPFLGLIGAALTFLLKNTKNAKLKKIAETSVKIIEATEKFIVNAETRKNWTGAEKKAWVINEVKGFAIDNNLSFNEAYVSGIIEGIITITKEVNFPHTGKDTERGI